MQISLKQSCYQQMIQHCTEAFPEEACGILLAPDGDSTITACMRIDNVHEQKTSAFRFDPEQWVNAHYWASRRQLTIAGIYHSHPTAEAVPSSRDVAGLLDSQLLYAIVSLKQKDSLQIKFYRRNVQNQFINYPLVLT